MKRFKRFGQIVNIFNPIGGRWKSYQLQHWFGKRISYRGKYVRIMEMQLDRNMNFTHWRIVYNGEYVNVSDPKFRPSFLP